MKYDICIVGGGPAGCACAYNAAKLGLKAVLIEKNNYLGGLMTGGLVVPVMKTDSSGINTDFFNALIERAKKYNGQVEYFDKNKGWFNPNILKIVLDDMLAGAGVKILFEYSPIFAQSNKNLLSDLEISSNMLSLHIYSKYYLDSTGDSKIFQLLNENFFEDDLIKQPCSLRFIMSGINLEKLREFLLKIDPDVNVTNSCIAGRQIHLTSAYTWDSNNWNLTPLFQKALDANELKPFDTAYFQIFTVAGANGSVAFNCPRLTDFNPKDPFARSNALIEARAAIYRLSKFMIKHFDGFQNAYISQIADITGVRESNKIIAKKQCIFDGTIIKNPILSGNYPIDIHSNEKNASVLKTIGKYYLGIDSLISKNYSNLYAAGRNLGADKSAQSALRTQLSCMSMGEAVAKHVKSIIN